MEKFLNIYTSLAITIYLAGFFAKNIITAKRTGQSIKTNSWKVNTLTINIGILYTLTYFCIFFKHHLLFDINIFDLFYIKIAGIAFMTVALITGIVTLITMKNSWRMGITTDQNTALIINGIFRFSRNPYFLSYFLIFLGVFLVFPTAIFLVFYIPFVIITHSLVLDEEKYLTKQHGESYMNYKNSAKRYLFF